MPFEQARTLLCEGEALRRARHPAASRPPLRHALTIFNRLGARPWAASPSSGPTPRNYKPSEKYVRFPVKGSV